MSFHRLLASMATITPALCIATQGSAQELDRQRDRGPGLPVSMFGTYIERGELLVYPFFEYYRDHDAEYSPDELGFGLDQDFRGEGRAYEWLIFLGYGITDRLAVELEAAWISERLDRSPADPAGGPTRIEEAGLGDIEGQLRWRWAAETASRPGIFSYFETVLPLQRDRRLIGTREWEFKLGTGVVRGFRFGTMTLRAAVEWDGEDSKLAPGEYALEYLKRLSPGVRVFAAVEGSEDEIEFIPELQLEPLPNVRLKLNSAFGITSKAADWAPEVGVMFSFR